MTLRYNCQIQSTNNIRALLLKTRILKYIANVENQEELDIGDIKNVLDRFDYPIDLQILALNELLDKPTPFLLSYGSDEYKDPKQLFHGDNDIVKITELGLGYVDKLYKELFYIQEMMFDTYVTKRIFVSVNFFL